MNERTPENEFDRDVQLRAPLARLDSDVTSPTEHDAIVLQAARAAALSISQRATQRTSRWRMPLSLAASFLVGVTIAVTYTATYTSQSTRATAEHPALTMPVTLEMRGATDARAIRVEDAPADAWYRYIQELIYAGDVQLAARHLQRFVELHPNYEHRP